MLHETADIVKSIYGLSVYPIKMLTLGGIDIRKIKVIGLCKVHVYNV